MTDGLHKISIEDVPNEFAITDGDGNVLMLVLVSDSGYVNVDFRHVKPRGGRVFELGGPVQENGPTIDGRLDFDIPETERGVPTFLSIDGDVDTE